MLELDGFETCRRIRKLEGGEHVPVLMMTGLDDVESIDYAYRVGATDFVTKPINYAVLPRRVQYMHRATATAAELRESSRRLENAQRMANLGHWEWHTSTKTLLCSTETERLLGVESASEIAFPQLLSRVHDEDAKDVSESLQSCLADRTTQENIFRVLLDDDVLFYIRKWNFLATATKKGSARRFRTSLNFGLPSSKRIAQPIMTK